MEGESLQRGRGVLGLSLPPLEGLAAAAPLLFLSYTEWLRNHPSERLRRFFRLSVILTIELTALGALYVSSFWRFIFD